MRVFLSGPITTGGISTAEARRRFSLAERWAREKSPGCDVFNPMRQIGAEADRASAMTRCLRVLCDMPKEPGEAMVLQLPGWRKSEGAALEAEAARQLGLERRGVTLKELEDMDRWDGR